jgi:DNA-binding transcriptional LysR family regulator
VLLINLELLRTFVVAADAPTFSAAARALFVTKSAVSQQIKTLETQLGVELFERIGRRVQVTHAGARLASSLRRELQAIDEALEAVVSEKREVKGEVRIGAPRPFARVWLRPRLARLLTAHAELQAQVSFGTPSELETMLVGSALDLAIVARKPTSALLEARPIFTEVFEAYASRGYLRAYGTPATAADFAAHKWIAYDEDRPMQSVWWRATFAGAPARGEMVCHVASLDEMLALAQAGVGIAVLPTYFVHPPTTEGAQALQPIRPKGRASGRARNAIYLAWRRNAVATARFVAAREALEA